MCVGGAKTGFKGASLSGFWERRRFCSLSLTEFFDAGAGWTALLLDAREGCAGLDGFGDWKDARFLGIRRSRCGWRRKEK